MTGATSRPCLNKWRPLCAVGLPTPIACALTKKSQVGKWHFWDQRDELTRSAIRVKSDVDLPAAWVRV